jgi:hypothetical protein
MEQYFISLAALVPLIVLATDFIIRWLKIVTPTTKQIISWVISVLLCLFAAWIDIGIFAGISFPKTVIYGFAAGLVANGVFDVNLVQTFLDFVFKFLPKKE